MVFWGDLDNYWGGCGIKVYVFYLRVVSGDIWESLSLFESCFGLLKYFDSLVSLNFRKGSCIG